MAIVRDGTEVVASEQGVIPKARTHDCAVSL